jgi:hypothetical protein
MKIGYFALLPLLLATGCAFDPESTESIEEPGLDAQETIVIIDPVPDCEMEFGAGFEAQSIEGQWVCVCVSSFYCGDSPFSWGGGGSVNPTGGGGGTPPDPELEEEEKADQTRNCMLQCESQVPASVDNCFESGWDGTGPVSCATQMVGNHCQGMREYCRSTLIYPDGMQRGPSSCTTATAAKACKSYYESCFQAWKSSGLPRAQDARDECIYDAFNIGDDCKMACVQEHGQGVTCDAYTAIGGWGKDIDNGTVEGNGCCGSDGTCVACELHGATECTFGDFAEQH